MSAAKTAEQAEDKKSRGRKTITGNEDQIYADAIKQLAELEKQEREIEEKREKLRAVTRAQDLKQIKTLMSYHNFLPSQIFSKEEIEAQMERFNSLRGKTKSPKKDE